MILLLIHIEILLIIFYHSIAYCWYCSCLFILKYCWLSFITALLIADTVHAYSYWNIADYLLSQHCLLLMPIHIEILLIIFYHSIAYCWYCWWPFTLKYCWLSFITALLFADTVHAYSYWNIADPSFIIALLIADTVDVHSCWNMPLHNCFSQYCLLWVHVLLLLIHTEILLFIISLSQWCFWQVLLTLNHNLVYSNSFISRPQILLITTII